METVKESEKLGFIHMIEEAIQKEKEICFSMEGDVATLSFTFKPISIEYKENEHLHIDFLYGIDGITIPLNEESLLFESEPDSYILESNGTEFMLSSLS